MNSETREMTPLEILKSRKERNAVPNGANAELSPLQELLRRQQRAKATKQSDYLRRLAEKALNDVNHR